MAEDKKKEIAVIEITEEYMKDRLYEFRGKKVMLDSDLAEIYGYETKNFKRQVKNNIAKFEGDDFMFELTDDETENLRTNFSTANISTCIVRMSVHMAESTELMTVDNICNRVYIIRGHQVMLDYVSADKG